LNQPERLRSQHLGGQSVAIRLRGKVASYISGNASFSIKSSLYGTQLLEVRHTFCDSSHRSPLQAVQYGRGWAKRTCELDVGNVELFPTIALPPGLPEKTRLDILVHMMNTEGSRITVFGFMISLGGQEGCRLPEASEAVACS